MSAEKLQEARRQIEICNACRYCEGYCAVFPAITRQTAFADGDITQLANLCHNCRGCYYACQYTEPHEFAINLPRVLAEVRTDSWRELAWPSGFAKAYDRHGVAMGAMTVLCLFFLILGAGSMRGAGDGEGFYQYLSHGFMVAIFAPAFIVPLLAMVISIRRYWRHVGGGAIGWIAMARAFHDVATLRNLGGGQDQGCNFEDEDRFSNARRIAHQLTLWGFLLCFASTSSATVLHYAFDMQAPYGVFSLPKLFGVPGGLMLSAGTFWMVVLKLQADGDLSDGRVRGGDMAFVLLLFAVSTSGLLLYAATYSGLVPYLLTFHLATVLTLFLTLPYSKFVHGFYRLAALLKNARDAG
ncbi:tricarballylate utilization 4Fe-4S protein TcuB [Roseobacter sp.]|uniref:tricarballylate utilization 4Fe-4S protein TcuB n=1 Tax=Roseobacter sp. TaxID=1907202 RepID=UPI0038596C4B